MTTGQIDGWVDRHTDAGQSDPYAAILGRLHKKEPLKRFKGLRFTILFVNFTKWSIVKVFPSSSFHCRRKISNFRRCSLDHNYMLYSRFKNKSCLNVCLLFCWHWRWCGYSYRRYWLLQSTWSNPFFREIDGLCLQTTMDST